MEYKQHAFVSGELRKELVKKFEAEKLLADKK